jgi:hypothetical protein
MMYKAHLRLIGAAVAAMVCLSPQAAGQVQAGHDVLLNLDGTISAGYSGSNTNEGPSSHGILFGGTGNLGGSYYSPQFLSFDVSPFYNQSRNSSNFDSITDSSGVTARANLFGGSPFPGSITYSRVYNNESNYLIPGIANFKTNGNTQTLGVGWSLNLKGLPSLQAGYQQGSSDTSLYGAQSESLTNFHSVFGNANTSVDGFHLSGGVHYSDGGSQFPEIAAGKPIENASSNSTTYTFNASRSTFFAGSSWVNYTRNIAGFASQGLSSSETADIVSSGLAMKPTARLSVQISGDYNDSLAGTLYQQANSSGVITPVAIPAGTSTSWDLFAQAQYTLFKGMYTGGSVSRRQQLFLGNEYDATAYSGSLSFGHNVLGGQFTSSGSVTYNSLSTHGESMLGFLSNATYIRQIGGWNLSGSFHYSQNVQTILVAFTTSGYGYSTSAGHRIGRLNWTGTAAGSKSLLTQEQGTNTFTQNYSTGLSGRWLGASAGYSRSSGTGLLTGAGITALPTGVPLSFLPTAVLFGGTTYSLGLGSTPIRGLTVNGTWLKSVNTTLDASAPSDNKTEQTSAYLIYRFRKVDFTAGYSRLLQGFSASGVPPALVTSYYFGISRWFKVF